MIDPIQLVRQWLLASSAVQAIAGLNVFGEVLPEHYDPTSNSAIVISLKGGAGHAEIGSLWEGEVQIRTWAGYNQFVLARSLYGAVYDTMHGQNMVTFAGFGTIVASYEFMSASQLVDNDMKWATMVGAFKVIARQDQPTTLPTWVDNTQSAQQYIDQEIQAIDFIEDGGSGS